MSEEAHEKVIEAEVLSDTSVEKLQIDPSKFIKRMMAGGWRTSSGKKNLSPKRVEKRRKKNKAARKSRAR
jgi:hypothetical protein